MITTVTFFRFSGFSHQWWAFTQMVRAHSSLRKSEGIKFYKLLGTGGGSGFGSIPNFSTYCLLAVWNTKDQFRNFIQTGIGREYSRRSDENLTFFLKPVHVRGSWGGIQPFIEEGENSGKKIAILTRAHIRPTRQVEFWRNVPQVSKRILSAPGLLFARGIGELPLLEQATFSLWDSVELMEQFAYKKKDHADVIKKTRHRNWYSEELFVRFEVLKTEGALRGISFNER